MLLDIFSYELSYIDELYTGIKECEAVIPINGKAQTTLFNFVQIYEWLEVQGRLTGHRPILYEAYSLLFTYARELVKEIDADHFEVKGGVLQW